MSNALHYHPQGRSIFWKLVVIFIVTGALVMGGVGGAFRRAFRPQKSFREFAERNVSRYADELIADLPANPPTKLKTDLGLSLRIETKTGELIETSDETLPSVAKVRETLKPRGHAFGRIYGKPYLIKERGERVYLFSLHKFPVDFNETRVIFGLFLGIGLVLLGAFVALRLLLRPLHLLLDGVDRIAKGDLKFRLTGQTVRRSLEWKQLSDHFNSFADRIEAMVRAKEQLLADVSHEIRSPLARLRVAIELPDADREVMRREIRRMDDLISQLLEVSRLNLGTGLNQKQDLIPVASLLKPLEERYGDSVRMDTSRGGSLVGDFTLLDRAVSNLIENAIRYRRNAPVQVRILPAQDGLIGIEVADDGEGIPETELAHIFEPFYQIDPARSQSDTGRRSGFGLGLNLVKRIAEAHGGRIDAKSLLGQGSQFTLWVRGN